MKRYFIILEIGNGAGETITRKISFLNEPKQLTIVIKGMGEEESDPKKR